MNKVRINSKKYDFELFVFDKDGTLIDIHHYWSSMIKLRTEFLIERFCIQHPSAMNDLMNDMGIDIDKNLMKSEGPVGIMPRSFIIKTAYQTVKKYTQKVSIDDVARTFLEVDNYSKKIIGKLIIPLPNIPELVHKLTNAGIKVALATTDITSRAQLALETIGISEYFCSIMGVDMVKNPKPAPDYIDILTQETNVSRSKTVVVGDAHVDTQMAKNANTHFIGVKTGLYNEDFLKESEILINDLNEIEII